MRRTVNWIYRSTAFAAITMLALAVAATPANAAVISFSTTGAAARAVYLGNGSWDLFARDPLTDGHCARVQEKRAGESSWRWKGDMVCTSAEQWVGFGQSDFTYRVCRTGVLNCSSAKELP